MQKETTQNTNLNILRCALRQFKTTALDYEVILRTAADESSSNANANRLTCINTLLSIRTKY